MFEYLWISLLFGALVGAWMTANSRDRGAETGEQVGWFILGLLFSLLGLIIYLIARPKAKRR